MRATAVTPPLVSVIIATYNAAHVLRDAIDSALGQSYPALEVIVVDDGSSDETQEVLSAYGDRIVTLRQDNRGCSAARNAGLRVARGAYVAWLDADDLFAPDKIALQVSVLERRADIVLVSTDFEGFDSHGPRPGSVRTYYGAFNRIPGGADTIYATSEMLDPASVPWVRDQRARPMRLRIGTVRHHLIHGSCVHPGTGLMRRDAMLEAGELDETLKTSMEYPFLFRIARIGAFAFIDHPLLQYRLSPGSLSAEAPMALTILQIVRDLAEREPDVVAADPAVYRRRLATCHFNVACAFAEDDRPRALRELGRALRRGLMTPAMLRVSLRILLPSTAIRWMRRLKQAADAWVGYFAWSRRSQISRQ